MSSLVDGRIERRLGGGVAIVAAATTVLKKVVDESRSLSTSTRSTTAQLPSPLPSPPPATTQLSSSSSSALTPRRSASDHTTVLLTHSTPPQSPFMDDKPIIMRLNTGSAATMPAATTTTVTPDDDNQNSASIINLIVDEPATSMTTSSMTPTASSTTTTSTSTTQLGDATSTTTTTTIVDSSQHQQQQQQAPHTPPESNDGTQSSTSEMKLNGEELARKLAHYNSLNAEFKNETLSARLESTRRRLRSIHSIVFNRHLANYLASNSAHSPDQMIGDEIAYEIARRREDDEEEDEDDDDDDDDNMSLTSSSSSEQPDDDQLVYAAAAATPRENDSSAKNSTGDVHFVDNSELNLLNNLCADDYWSMQRVKLGSEWQRLQTKMAYLRRTNEQVNKYVRSEREIEKLSKSLKDSIRKTFSVSDEDVDTEEDRSLADHSSSASSSDYSDQEEEDEETSRRVMGSSTTTNKRRSRQGIAGGGLKQVVRFDDEIVLKSFYVTLMNLRTGLFKEACVCGGETASRPLPQVAATRLEATKSCIFCHMFKKYDGDLVDRAANRVLSLPTRDLSSSVDTTPQEQESNYSIRADERVIKLYHSYCKQPKYGEKLQWTRVPLEAANKRHKAQPLRPRNHVDDEMSVVVGDEYTDLSSLVNERLNRLFGCSHSSRENRENENNSNHSGEQADKDKSQPPCSSNIVLKDDFDEIEIDPGYEISLDDIKKLPDFSYDELKFLCGDELWLEENGDEPKTKLSNSRKRKEQDEDEMARFDEQKRLRLDSNR